MKKILVCFCIFILAISTYVSAIELNLRYECAGTYEYWTEDGYYSSPAVYDIDDDGEEEIIFSNYSITVLDAKTGETEWKVNSGYDITSELVSTGKSNGHTWPDIEIEDINGDGKKEIITGHGGGVISVLDGNGYHLPGWPQNPNGEAIKSIEVADLDGDGKKEIVAGYGYGGHKSVYVFNYDGQIRDGWPKVDDDEINGDETWLYGVFMDNIATGDIDNDGKLEIIVPSDLSFVSAFEEDGTPIAANKFVYGERNWGQVAFFEDYAAEIRNDNRGWGFDIKGGEFREDLYKGEFGHAKAQIYDVDDDGKSEIIVSSIMCDRTYFPDSYPPTEYMTIGIFNADRTRYKNEELGYDWESIPADLGRPLYQNEKTVASSVFQVPVISDIDGDGDIEILFNSYNGKVHCFRLDKKEPYAWPYSLMKRSNPMFQYASPVVCKDIDHDGKQEIIFASFYDDDQGYGNVRGYVYVLNYEGKELARAILPDSKEKGQYPNGGKAMPNVCDIDNDGDYEIVINTTQSAICVYDID